MVHTGNYQYESHGVTPGRHIATKAGGDFRGRNILIRAAKNYKHGLFERREITCWIIRQLAAPCLLRNA